MLEKLKAARAGVIFVSLTGAKLFGQGLLVLDQGNGSIGEPITQATALPDNQIAQSFTPFLSAVGFVQLQTITFQDNNGAGVVFALNLREGAYNGPILSSTTPVVMIRGPIQTGPFYFPDNIPVTPGQLYFFEPVLQSSGQVDIATKFPSSYLGGDLWSNGGKDSTVDLWFREGIVVPEPRTVWLLLFGSCVFIWRSRGGRNSRL